MLLKLTEYNIRNGDLPYEYFIKRLSHNEVHDNTKEDVSMKKRSKFISLLVILSLCSLLLVDFPVLAAQKASISWGVKGTTANYSTVYNDYLQLTGVNFCTYFSAVTGGKLKITAAFKDSMGKIIHYKTKSVSIKKGKNYSLLVKANVSLKKDAETCLVVSVNSDSEQKGGKLMGYTGAVYSIEVKEFNKASNKASDIGSNAIDGMLPLPSWCGRNNLRTRRLRISG